MPFWSNLICEILYSPPSRQDFDIRKGAFRRYVRTATGSEIMRQAQAIFKRWNSDRNGTASAAELARELDIPGLHARYLLDLLTFHSRH